MVLFGTVCRSFPITNIVFIEKPWANGDESLGRTGLGCVSVVRSPFLPLCLMSPSVFHPHEINMFFRLGITLAFR